jgi:hypothetical protein
MSFIGATGYNENQEQLDSLKDEIDGLALYQNTITGYPDPTHTAVYGINPLNPNLFGLVERAEVNISLLQSGLETEGTTISGIETTISGIETTISGIETEVSGIQTEILGIQGEITGIDSTISSIEFIQLPALGTALTALIGATDVIAVDARNKANRALDIWDYSGDNVYHKKSGNVGIGTTFGSVLNNKLEVNGNINIPTGSTFRINNEPFNYSHLAGTQPVSSKWTNATDTTTNIYYNTGNVGIGITTAINNKLEVAGNLNISAGSKYKINNVDLAFSDLGGSLSYNSLTNQLTGGTNIQILNGVINNTYTYTLPTATTAVIGGVRPDGTTILINNGVISSTAGTAQVNSDWNETNTSLKSFILNKPTIVNSRWSKTGNEISYNDGNVGIGTADPNRSLHLHKFGISQEVGLILSDDSTTSTSANNRGLHLIKASDNNGYLWNYENKDLLFATNAIERMRISNTGSVGIGTATNISGVLLDVNGTIESRTGIGANSVFYFRGVANSDINRVISAGQFSTNSAVNDMVIRSTNKLVLQSGIADPAIVIGTNNSVGIGTTAPQNILHIHKNALSQDVRIIITDNSCINRGFHLVKLNNNFAYLWNLENTPMIFGTNEIERMRITNTGNVNINEVLTIGSITQGGFNAVTKLVVYGAATDTQATAIFKHPNDSQGIGIRYDGIFQTNANAHLILTTSGTGGIRFNTGGIDRMTINSGGNISFQHSVWLTSTEGKDRFYLNNNATTYIQGYGSQPIEFRNGTLANTPIAWFNSEGELTCMFETQTTTDSDHIIIRNNTELTQRGRYRLLIGYNTFTGFHRCYYEDDEVFNNDMSKEDIDIFKNNYKGRIVISTGKIKTDFTRDVPKTDEQREEVKIEEGVSSPYDEGVRTEEETTKEEPPPISSTPKEETKSEWYSAIDKDGITIEDAIPIVQLCKVRKDKRVYGVLGSPTRNTNNKARLIVNSVGEGSICVCNSNGNIENGDYIQSSDVLGYGEKQDDDILHNYSVAKAVMDCTFELDSPYYQCYELASGVRVALIACTYHCG